MKLKHLVLIVAVPAVATAAFWYFTSKPKVKEPEPVVVDHDKQEIKTLRDELSAKDSLLFNMAGQIADLRDSVDKLKKVKPVTIKTVKKNEKVVPISDASSAYFTGILSKRYSKGK